MISPFRRRVEVVPDLRVGRLRLAAITPEMMRAEQVEDYTELGRLLEAKVTREWPPVDWEPHVFRFMLKQFDERPDTVGWHRYVLFADSLGLTQTLVGAIGAFPKPFGDAEIGYSTLPQFQRRGIGTAAARTLVEWLLTLDGVHSVSANTFPRLPESIKIMERCGLTFMGHGEEPGTVMYRRMR